MNGHGNLRGPTILFPVAWSRRAGHLSMETKMDSQTTTMTAMMMLMTTTTTMTTMMMLMTTTTMVMVVVMMMELIKKPRQDRWTRRKKKKRGIHFTEGMKNSRMDEWIHQNICLFKHFESIPGSRRSDGRMEGWKVRKNNAKPREVNDVISRRMLILFFF